MSLPLNSWRGKIKKFFVCLTVINLILYASFFNAIFIPLTSVKTANAQDLCEVPVDTVLVMDTSGSMDEGEHLSKCEWWQIELVVTSYKCVKHEENGITQAQCDAKPAPSQCNSHIFSPATNSKLTDAKAAANSFIDNLGANDQSGIVFFNTIADLAKELSGDHAATKATIDGLVPEGATNIGGAIQTGNDELISVRANPKAVKAMILLTDGKANKPNGPGYGEYPADVAYAESMAVAAAALDIKIFTIGLGTDGDINQTMLQNIASTTLASYHHAPTSAELTGIYDQISQEICRYGSISGCKYKDVNNNRTIEQGEEKLSNWEITLTGGPNGPKTSYTDNQGCYLFSGLKDGTYNVAETLTFGWAQTYPTGGNYNNLIISDHNSIEDIDFANYQPVCGNSILDSNFGEVCELGDSQTCATQSGYAGNQSCGQDCLGWDTCQTNESCGDGVKNGHEECDDGNAVDQDGCSSACMIEILIYQCNNGADDDGDGLVDADDPGCHTDGNPNNPGSYDPNDDDETDPILPGEIVINEIMQNPKAASDTYGEWFELYNNTDHNIDLDGCAISDNFGDNHITNSNLIIQAHDYSVIARNGNIGLNGGIIPDYVYSFILSNTSDAIILTCGSIEIDRVEYDNGATFPDPDGASMILNDPNNDNNIGANWCTSSSSYGAGDLGTPGALNDQCGGAAGSLKVCKFEDNDGNATTTADQTPVQSWDFTITVNQSPKTQTTGADGCTTFSNLTPGDYHISETLQNTWYLLDPATGEQTVPVHDGQETTANFYNTRYGSISGYKLVDTDGATSTTADQYSDTNWTIKLFDSGSMGQPLTTVQTDSQGRFEFNNLKTGIYILDEELPSGWAQLSAPTSPITINSHTQSNDNYFVNYHPTCGNGVRDYSYGEICEIGDSQTCATQSGYAGQQTCNQSCDDWNTCEPSESCGDGTVNGPETCDDGNTASGDGCSAVCQTESGPGGPVCGNQVVETGEQCDDGNTASGDGCSAVCSNEICARAGEIVVNEIMQNPLAVGDTAGEWFEVYNASSTPLNLKNCLISDMGGNSHIIAADLVLPAKGYAVLARNGDPAANGGFTADYVYGSAFTLGNDDDEVIITCCGAETDRVEYTGVSPWPNPNGASMVLNNPINDNNNGANWCISSSSYGAGDKGTPGALNDSCAGGRAVCGNQIIETGETCDDGNTTDGDGCSSLCALETPPVLGLISGYKYQDTDGDLNTTNDWAGAGNWTINLFNSTSSSTPLATTTTNSQGYYVFNNLVAGDYDLSEDLLSGWTQLSAPTSTIHLLASASSTENNFINYQTPSPLLGLISGYKYQDTDGNASTTADQNGSSGWTINLFNSISTTTPVATTTSGNQGYYVFNNLAADDYSLSENLLTGWSQLSAPTSTIHLLTGASSTLNNFINYQPAPVCGNSIKEGNEECDGGAGVPAGMRCNSDCQVVRAGDGGGDGAGGGGGEENENDGTNGGWGGGGGTTTSTTSGSSQPTVLGAEGKPELAIDKTVGVDFANPGDEVEYTVKITNNGNLTAYNVNLSDTLPAGLTFLFGGAAKTFTIGDIVPGESKTTVYKVKVDKAMAAGFYANSAQVTADNHNPINDSVNLEVRKVKVLGEELAPTGFDRREFIYLILILFSLASSIFVLRKKYQDRKVASNR